MSELLEYFRSEVESASSVPNSNYAKAVASLATYLGKLSSCIAPDVATNIIDWLISLRVKEYSLRTVLPYLNAISSLYNKAVDRSIVPADDIFKQLKATLKSEGFELWDSGITAKDAERMKKLTAAFALVEQSEDIALALITISLMNGAMPILEVARLQRADLSKLESESAVIAKRFMASTRKYVFPLNQSSLTDRQMATTVANIVKSGLERNNIRTFGSPDDTLRSYWAYAAVRSGIQPHALRPILRDVPGGLKILSLCRNIDNCQTETNDIKEIVARAFVDNPRRWYVMRLRPRIKYADLTRRLDTLGSHADGPELFYPCDEIMRRVGRRRIVESRPVIPDIVFFRSRSTAISRLFAAIGDLAWCYTVSGRSGDSYAAISDSAFRLFQQTIGQFTPDYDVAPIGTIPLRENDRVVIVGGPYQGCEGRLLKTPQPAAGGTTVYRLQLYNDLGIEWTVCADSRQLRKAEAKSGS